MSQALSYINRGKYFAFYSQLEFECTVELFPSRTQAVPTKTTSKPKVGCPEQIGFDLSSKHALFGHYHGFVRMKMNRLVRRFQKIKSSLQPRMLLGISKVNLPQDLVHAMDNIKMSNPSTPVHNEDAHLTKILKQTIKTKWNKDTFEWTTVMNKDTLEKALLLYCNQHL